MQAFGTCINELLQYDQINCKYKYLLNGSSCCSTIQNNALQNPQNETLKVERNSKGGEKMQAIESKTGRK